MLILAMKVREAVVDLIYPKIRLQLSLALFIEAVKHGAFKHIVFLAGFAIVY